MDFDIKLLGSIIAGITLQGGILLAAAKTVFATKDDYKSLLARVDDDKKEFNHKLYDLNGIPIYMQKIEFAKNIQELSHRNDILELSLSNQISKVTKLIEKIRVTQETINIAISQLQVRNERTLNERNIY